MGGYDDRQQQGYGAPQQGYGAPQQRMPARGPPGGARQLRPIKSPGGNAYAFGNLYV
jgi:vesicle-fusing ATPase